MEKRLEKGELIGKNIKITSSKNSSNIGIQGKIIDETKNTMKIRTKDGKNKTIIKSNVTFTIKTDGKEYEIKGEDIQSAPEERIKAR